MKYFYMQFTDERIFVHSIAHPIYICGVSKKCLIVLGPGIQSRNNPALRVLTVQGGEQTCKQSLVPLQDDVYRADIT